MARGSTVLHFNIELSDVDKGVYEGLELKVAQHPSESGAYLLTRVLAFALEYDEQLAFSQGLSTSDVPAIWSHDLTGALLAWIEVGTPSAARLHKASKSADRVAVYCHKEPHAWLKNLAGSPVHRSESIGLFALPWREIGQIADQLERRNSWVLSRVENTIYLESGENTWEFMLRVIEWPKGT